VEGIRATRTLKFSGDCRFFERFATGIIFAFAATALTMEIEMIAVPDKTITALNVARYQKGCIYEVSPVMAALFICEGWARTVSPGPSRLDDHRAADHHAP
jgi:hypothetical protein